MRGEFHAHTCVDMHVDMCRHTHMHAREHACTHTHAHVQGHIHSTHSPRPLDPAPQKQLIYVSHYKYISEPISVTIPRTRNSPCGKQR